MYSSSVLGVESLMGAAKGEMKDECVNENDARQKIRPMRPQPPPSVS